MAEKKEKKFKTLLTPVFRVSFPHTFEKSQYGDGKPKFGLAAIWEPAKFNAEEKGLWAAMGALADEVCMARFKKKVKDLPSNFKKPIRDGSEKEDLDGYGAGKKFANLTTTRKPNVVDRQKQPITDAEEFYAGCYARATVSCYSYDNKGKGVAFGLVNVQKVKDGEAFGFSESVDESFADDLGPDPDADEIGGAEAEADPF